MPLLEQHLLLAGFLLGSRQTLLETFDGGKTWKARDVAVRARVLSHPGRPATILAMLCVMG